MLSTRKCPYTVQYTPYAVCRSNAAISVNVVPNDYVIMYNKIFNDIFFFLSQSVSSLKTKSKCIFFSRVVRKMINVEHCNPK